MFAQTRAWEGACIRQREDSAGRVFEVATIQGLQCLLANVLSTFLTLVGIAAFVMVVASAFRIMLAGDKSQEMDKAKTAVTQAVIGLVVAISAFIILNLIAEFTGVKTILNFSIPESTKQW